MAIEIVDFPIKNGGSLHSYFDITRGYWIPSNVPSILFQKGPKALGTTEVGGHSCRLRWVPHRRDFVGSPGLERSQYGTPIWDGRSKVNIFKVRMDHLVSFSSLVVLFATLLDNLVFFLQFWQANYCILWLCKTMSNIWDHLSTSWLSQKFSKKSVPVFRSGNHWRSNMIVGHIGKSSDSTQNCPTTTDCDG